MTFEEKPWLHVREMFGSEPIVSQLLEGDLNIYVERYICESMSPSIEPLPTTALVTQFGGSKVGEGNKDKSKAEFFPSFSIVVPANCATEWQFSGFVDFAVFYFPPQPQQPFCRLIEEHCHDKNQLISITNPLIAASAQQIAEELFHNKSNNDFIERLMLVMLEQTWRLLNGDAATEINPSYIHLGRIHSIIKFIQNNLDQPLSIEQLAKQVGLSSTHFRRIFSKATGMTTHQFIMHMRLKKARELLTNTDMPMIQISTSLGFHSQSHFTACFKKMHAVTPARYRRLFLSTK